MFFGGWMAAVICGGWGFPDGEKLVSSLSTLAAFVMAVVGICMGITAGKSTGFYVHTVFGKELLFHTKNQFTIDRMVAVANALKQTHGVNQHAET